MGDEADAMMQEEILRSQELNEPRPTRRPRSAMQDLEPAVPDPSDGMVRKTLGIGQLMGSLAKAQAELGAQKFPRNKEVTVRPRDQTKKPYTFSYCTFDTILGIALPILGKNGLAIVQLATADRVTTILAHQSGEFIESTLLLPQAYSNPQEYGSAITYRKRYALCSMLAIHADEDDDGNAEEGNTIESHRERQQHAPPEVARQSAIAAEKKRADEDPEFRGEHGLNRKEWDSNQDPKVAIGKGMVKAITAIVSKNKAAANEAAAVLQSKGLKFLWQASAETAQEIYDKVKAIPAGQ